MVAEDAKSRERAVAESGKNSKEMGMGQMLEREGQRIQDAYPIQSLLSTIDILVLCGGFGKRLQSIVSDRQKAIADVKGRPFITFILDQISKAGGKSVLLCTGYMGEQLESFLGKRYKALSLNYSKETEPLGTAGAIRQAFDVLKSDTLMVFNGDSYCDVNPIKLLRWHFENKSLCTLALVTMQDVSRYGCVNFDANCEVTSFSEKMPEKKSGWINSGIYCMSRELIAALPGNRNISLENDVFPTLIGKKFFVFPQDAQFIDIGTPSSYKEAETFFMNIDRRLESERKRSLKR